MATQSQQALHQLEARFQQETREYVGAQPCPNDAWCGYTQDGPGHGKCNHCGQRFKISDTGQLSAPDAATSPGNITILESTLDNSFAQNNFAALYDTSQYAWRRNGNLSQATTELIRDSSMRACGIRTPKDNADPTVDEVEAALTHIKRMGNACGVAIREDIDLDPSVVGAALGSLVPTNYVNPIQMPVIYHWRNMQLAYVGGDPSGWPNDDCALFIKALQGEI
jgi:hypothetical protein